MQCREGESCKTVTLLTHASEIRIGKLRIEFFLKDLLYLFVENGQDVIRDPVHKLAFVI